MYNTGFNPGAFGGVSQTNPYANLMSPEQKKQLLEEQKRAAKQRVFDLGGGILKMCVSSSMINKAQARNRGRSSGAAEYSFLGDYVSQERVREQSGKYLDNLNNVSLDDPKRLTIEKVLVEPLKKEGGWLDVQVSIGAELLRDLREKVASAGTSWVEIEFGVKSLQINPNTRVIFDSEWPEVEERGNPIFLIDPDEDMWNRDNWTAEDTGFPLERIRGRAAAVAVFDVSPSDSPRAKAPDIDYENLDELFGKKLKFSAHSQKSGYQKGVSKLIKESKEEASAAFQKEAATEPDTTAVPEPQPQPQG